MLRKEAIVPAFFDLSARIAGEVLQKFVNYRMRLAIVGDFAKAGRPQKDFMFESNCGRHVFFAASEGEAVEKLKTASA